jgi:hypothetical protein
MGNIYVEDQLKQSKIYFNFFYSQASFKKLNEMGAVSQSDNKGDNTLNPITLNNLNDFYIQAGNDNNGIFNLSNFYLNHGKYFAGITNTYGNFK